MKRLDGTRLKVKQERHEAVVQRIEALSTDAKSAKQSMQEIQLARREHGDSPSLARVEKSTIQRDIEAKIAKLAEQTNALVNLIAEGNGKEANDRIWRILNPPVGKVSPQQVPKAGQAWFAEIQKAEAITWGALMVEATNRARMNLEAKLDGLRQAYETNAASLVSLASEGKVTEASAKLAELLGTKRPFNPNEQRGPLGLEPARATEKLSSELKSRLLSESNALAAQRLEKDLAAKQATLDERMEHLAQVAKQQRRREALEEIERIVFPQGRREMPKSMRATEWKNALTRLESNAQRTLDQRVRQK